MANKYLVRNVLQLHENVYKIPNSFFFPPQPLDRQGEKSHVICSLEIAVVVQWRTVVVVLLYISRSHLLMQQQGGTCRLVCFGPMCTVCSDGRTAALLACLLAAVSRRRAYQWWCIIIPFLLELGFDEQQSPAPKLSYVYCIQQYSM